MNNVNAAIPILDKYAGISQKLKAHFGEATFNSWLKHLELISYEGGQVVLGAPTRFIRDWVSAHYGDEIKSFLRQEDPGLYSLDIIQAESRPLPAKEKSPADNQPIHNNIVDISIRTEQLGSPLDPRFTFENFVVGKPNELAHAASQSVAEARNVNIGSNPLFLYGGVGLGKTHLMHAIAWHIRKNNPARQVVYLSAEKFMYQFIRALRSKDIMSFKEQFRSVDVLMIDDVQFIGGKDSTQEEFFHTFNALIDQSKQLVISADRSPSDLEGIEERIRSRLGWGLVADVNTTTYELRLGILQSKLEQLKTDVPKQVLEFLAHRIVSNVRELEGALNKVIAHSNLFGREISLENTQEILQDLLRSNIRTITIDDIKRRVCDRYNLKISDLNSARRSRSIARPRQIAMYLAKKLTTLSLPEIGRNFGGKDHTTVIHAIKKVDELAKESKELADDLVLLQKILQS